VVASEVAGHPFEVVVGRLRRLFALERYATRGGVRCPVGSGGSAGQQRRDRTIPGIMLELDDPIGS
jgi:hypothetical protein